VIPLADGQVVGGRTSLWLDLVAVVLLALAIVIFVRKGRPQVIMLLLLGAVIIGIGSVVVGPSPVAAPDVSLRIVTPTDNSTVAADAPVEIRVDLEGGKLTSSTDQTAPNVGHLHISVDGSIVSMPGTPQATVELEPGRHLIVVEFVGADHQPFSPPIVRSAAVIARRRS
jgi:hypothetical protein